MARYPTLFGFLLAASVAAMSAPLAGEPNAPATGGSKAEDQALYETAKKAVRNDRSPKWRCPELDGLLGREAWCSGGGAVEDQPIRRTAPR